MQKCNHDQNHQGAEIPHRGARPSTSKVTLSALDCLPHESVLWVQVEYSYSHCEIYRDL